MLKKSLFISGKAFLPPPLELNGRRNVGTLKKRFQFFFVSLMARQLREELFFAASLSG